MIRCGRWVCGSLVLALGWGVSAPAQGADEAVFELKQVSPFPEVERDRSLRLVRGISIHCTKPRKQSLKRFPQLKSKRPLYGTAHFGPQHENPSQMVVLDFLLDESDGTGTGHDRLYVDTDRDGDLNDEKVLKPMKDPPAGAMLRRGTRRKVCFEYLMVDLDHGPQLGVRPFRILPVLTDYGGGRTQMAFIPAVAWKGTVRLGKREYTALLGQQYSVSARFDSPRTALYLTPVGKGAQRARWWGADTSAAMHCVDGTYYSLSASPAGDKLTVKPYDGDLGVLELGPGNRKLETFEMNGSLRSETTAVAVGEVKGEGNWPEKTRRAELPVGDYLPAIMSIYYGRLRLSVSNNYHQEGGYRSGKSMARVYGIKIRKDKPFVLDFSNKPKVLFVRPTKEQRVRRGDEVRVEAVLIDPVLDVMIRGLDDTSRKTKKTYKSADGKTHTYERNLSLDPKVTVSNSRGKQVAEGKMPFG